MYPCVPREAQPVVCKEVRPFTISQIRKIMTSRAKKGKEKRMIQECEIDNQIEYRLISVVRLRAIIEERLGSVYMIDPKKNRKSFRLYLTKFYHISTQKRLLGKTGHEEVDDSIENHIWSTKISDLKLNKIYRGMIKTS